MVVLNAREIQKLRKKFIFVAMISLACAMFCIGGAILAANAISNQYAIHSALDTIADNDGDLWGDSTERETDDDEFRNFTISSLFTAQFDKYNHYFAVIYDADGNIVSINTSINSTDEQEIAKTYSDRIYKSGRSFGRYGSYYYKVEDRDNGQSIVVCLDCRSEIWAQTRLFYTVFGICLLGFFITLLLVHKLSWRAIQPEIENSARQKQFITNASHELKTPLAVIRANTELEQMLHGEDEWNQSTISQVDRMNGLIQNLVMITRAAEQEDKSEMDEVDVSKAVNESLDPFESLAKQEKKTMSRSIDDNVRLLADSSKIRQLVTILIDNAIKYCDDNGEISVSLIQIKRGRGVQLSVSNSYSEGANVDYNRFFDRFYREDSSHNIDKGGYGIGLSMAESICRQYSGSIRAEWKNGRISFICELY